MRKFLLPSALVTMTLPLFVLGCSSNASSPDGGSGDGGGGGAYNPPTSMSPTVSFVNDVIPVFVQSCAFTSCHNVESGKPLEFLALKDGTPVSQWSNEVYNGLVNKPTVEDPSMSYVKPGDVANSYLARKMDGALSDIASQCDPNNSLSTQNQVGPCGVQMPYNLPPIGDDKRAIVRNWIAQGAKNN